MDKRLYMKISYSVGDGPIKKWHWDINWFGDVSERVGAEVTARIKEAEAEYELAHLKVSNESR